MSGSILQRAKADAKRYVTSGGFEENITLTTPNRLTTIAITGYATKHWINFDTDGLPINAKNAHVCVDESLLITLGYPTRNAKGEVNLRNHIVSYPDSSGTLKKHVVNEQYPDETLGLIVLILGDYTGD